MDAEFRMKDQEIEGLFTLLDWGGFVIKGLKSRVHLDAEVPVRMRARRFEDLVTVIDWFVWLGG